MHDLYLLAIQPVGTHSNARAVQDLFLVHGSVLQVDRPFLTVAIPARAQECQHSGHGRCSAVRGQAIVRRLSNVHVRVIKRRLDQVTEPPGGHYNPTSQQPGT